MDLESRYKALGSAIVVQAIVDYRTAARKLRDLKKGNPYQGRKRKYRYKTELDEARSMLKDADEFFKSTWCFELCSRRYSDIISLVSDLDDMHIEEIIIQNRERRGD